MKDLFEKIKIINLILVYLVLITGITIISFLPMFNRIEYLTFNFWFLMINLLMLVWFIYHFIKNKVDLRSSLSDFTLKVCWKELLKIVFVNVLFSIGLAFIEIAIIGYLNPKYLNTFLNEQSFHVNSLMDVITLGLNIILITPLIEEFMFRGVILHRLNLRWGVHPAIIISSVVFGLLHFEIKMIGAICFGVYLALLFLKTKNILVPVTAHFLNNLLGASLLIIPFFTGNNGDNHYDYSTNEIIITGITGLILTILPLVFIIRYFIKNWPRSNSLSLTQEQLNAETNSLDV